MRLKVTCEDRLGLTRELLDILVEHQIDLRGIEIDISGIIYVNFPTLDFAALQHLLPAIRRIPGIFDVKTIACMPSEQEHNATRALLKVLPDAVVAIDMLGKITLANDAACSLLNQSAQQLLQQYLGPLLKGVHVSRWLEQASPQPLNEKVTLAGEPYLADFLPIWLTEESGEQSLAGAVVVLKSAYRIGQHFKAMRSRDTGYFDGLIAHSPAMEKLLNEARRLATLDAPLLIQGETGTGKELLARACHHASLRGEGPFILLNCAAIPDDAAEHELFGYAAGAFGNNMQGKRGVLDQANGGTLLLDEIGEMSALMQLKLLRVLQDGVFRRLGDEQEVTVDIRVICTTQQDLASLVQGGQFRQDLFYRLNVLNLHIPPLRERQKDILPLAQHFCTRFAAELERPRPRLADNLSEYLQHYPWPGNVRQLRHSLYRAISLLEGDELTLGQLALPEQSSLQGLDALCDGSLDDAVKGFERLLLERLYPQFPSTRQLARRLSISHTAIANKLKDYGIGKHKK
ncbi:TyrR family transcriptional regulator [Oceanisphaera marina]|uniref:HTH-type transcriptional regulatory protein TyrR n=1 Tax=Oceanisphaera marina TaxID=2017550 RepID=A0ABQ1ILR7_9GAMM|nr:transcriptional regulator TyrR [Oceanisphaera marina]GGB42447.1 TyrR family transcriptional regulator [Oceanisphaera marina]